MSVWTRRERERKGEEGKKLGIKCYHKKKKKNFNTYPHWSISLISSELVKSKKKNIREFQVIY